MPSERISPPTIFAFHKVRRGRHWDHTNIQPDRLCRILEAVASAGYRFDGLSATVLSSDSKTIALTFDDGYAHLVDSLPDLCGQFGVRPTLFIPCGLIGKTNRWDYSSVFGAETHLTTAEIRKLAESGFEFGSHSWSHRALTSLNSSGVKSELADSKAALEDITGHPVESISYPFGRVNSAVCEIASGVGYRYGLTTLWPSANQPKMTLGRLMIYGFDTPASVMHKLQGRMRWLERTKQQVTTSLASGTILYQRLSWRG